LQREHTKILQLFKDLLERPLSLWGESISPPTRGCLGHQVKRMGKILP